MRSAAREPIAARSIRTVDKAGNVCAANSRSPKTDHCNVHASRAPSAPARSTGVARDGYALSLRPMADLAGKAADENNLGCADVLAHGTRAVEVAGPTFEDEARHVFDGPSRPLMRREPHDGI